MGTIVEFRKLPDNHNIFRLLIYSKPMTELVSKATPLNKLIASKLIEIKPNRRTMQLEKCFLDALKELPELPIVKDIDVLFNPAYKVDVMKLLISAYKQKPYSIIWPGSYSDGKLFYSEDGYPDYRVYDIKDYDIMCVI